MPKYKFKKNFKTLIQIYLFYYFLNALNLYECQLAQDDVELINSNRNEENDFSDQLSNKKFSDSEFFYLENSNHNENDHHNDFNDKKNVNLNINNDLHDSEFLHEGAGDGLDFHEINENEVSGRLVLYQRKSPYLLRQDLEVLQHGVLEVEAGVKVHFAPMVGITVRGAMKAIVSSFFD